MIHEFIIKTLHSGSCLPGHSENTANVFDRSQEYAIVGNNPGHGYLPGHDRMAENIYKIFLFVDEVISRIWKQYRAGFVKGRYDIQYLRYKRYTHKKIHRCKAVNCNM